MGLIGRKIKLVILRPKMAIKGHFYLVFLAFSQFQEIYLSKWEHLGIETRYGMGLPSVNIKLAIFNANNSHKRPFLMPIMAIFTLFLAIFSITRDIIITLGASWDWYKVWHGAPW